MKVLDLFSGTYACSDSLNPDFSVTTASACVTPRRVATMTVYDSIERGAADECEPLRGRRPRTFTLTQLLVACVAVCVCSIAATTAVHRLSQEEPPDIEPRPDPPEPLDEPFRKAATTVVNTHQGPSRLANFDSGSAFDDDSALANFNDDSDSDSD